MACQCRLQDLVRRWVTLVLLLVTLAVAPAHAQPSPAEEEMVSGGSANEIAVAPGARDTQIADRLGRILEASTWFSALSVSVREGIVFLDG